MALEEVHLVIAEAIVAVLVNVWFLFKYWHRIKVLIRNKQMIFSITFSLAQCAVASLIYINLSNFSSNRMLTHYQQVEQENPNSICLDHLSDIFLDIVPDESEDGYTLLIGDHFPFFSLFLVACFGVASCHLDIINTYVFIYACTMVLNSISEQVTVMPPSVGYARCKKRYGVTRAEDFSYNFGLTGTCAGLMWSGHTANVACMATGLSHGLGRECAFWGRVMNKRFLFIRLHTYLIATFVIFQVLWLILSKDHYTVDIFVGVCIMTLMLCSDQMEYLGYRINPFLRKLDFPSKSRLEAYGAYLEAHKACSTDKRIVTHTMEASNRPRESASEEDVVVTVDEQHVAHSRSPDGVSEIPLTPAELQTRN